MAFTREQKRAWAQLPHVQERQRQYVKNTAAKKRALGIPQNAPLDPVKRAAYLARRTEQAAAGRARAEAHNAELKRVAELNAPIRKARANAKHREHRARIRAKAIAIMGGECEWCGFDIEAALQVDHIKPLRRGLNKVRESQGSVYRMIINGNVQGLQLLCACCHQLKTRFVDNADGSLDVNLPLLTCDEAA